MTLRVIVPARLDSSRLPEKMLRQIGNHCLFEHALLRVIDAFGANRVTAAVDGIPLAAVAEEHCRSVITSPGLRSGTDRCAAAADIFGWPDDDIVLNVQADMPFINPGHLIGFANALANGEWDMMTAYVDRPAVTVSIDGFERTAHRCHVGLYAYRRGALRRFAELPTSPLEDALRLEQMRAVENGFDIAYHAIPDMPFEVNTPEDLQMARWIAECLS